MKLYITTLGQLWAAVYDERKLHGDVKLVAGSDLFCSGITMISMLWKAEGSGETSHSYTVIPSWVSSPYWISSSQTWQLVGSQTDFCQPGAKGIASQRNWDTGKCPDLHFASQDRTAASSTNYVMQQASNPDSNLVCGHSLNMDRQQQEDGRAELRHDAGVLRFSLPMSVVFDTAG